MAIMETPYYVFLGYLPKKNEVGFDGQRSLLHSPTKPASFGIEAYFIFLR